MIALVSSVGLILGMGLTVPAQAAAPAGDRYAMGAVKTDFKASRRLGSRRAGLVCLPAGSFKWSDARPALNDASATLATVLHDRMPGIVDTADDPFSDERAATRFKLTATVEDFSLNGCVRNWGLAARLRHDHALSGHAHLSVSWDVFDRTTRTKVDHTTVETDFEIPAQVEGAAEALTAGLKLNVVQFARQRWPGPQG